MGKRGNCWNCGRQSNHLEAVEDHDVVEWFCPVCKNKEEE